MTSTLGYYATTTKIDHVTLEQTTQILNRHKIPYDRKSLFNLKKSKFPKLLIEQISKTHILMPIIQISALSIIMNYPGFELTFPKQERPGLAKRTPFSCDGYKTKWHLVSKKIQADATYDEIKVSSPLRVVLYTLFMLRELQICNCEICKKDIYIPNTALIKNHSSNITISDYEGQESKMPDIIVQ